MTQYVDSGEHLKIIMKLLRDDRKMINYEGFHVFKVRWRGQSGGSMADLGRSLSRTHTSLLQCRRY